MGVEIGHPQNDSLTTQFCRERVNLLLAILIFRNCIQSASLYYCLQYRVHLQATTNTNIPHPTNKRLHSDTMPLMTKIPDNSWYLDDLLEIVANTDETGATGEEFYDQAFEEGHHICDPKEFELGYDGVHWCLQFTKECFVNTWNKMKTDYWSPTTGNKDEEAEAAAIMAEAAQKSVDSEDTN